jgi:preprotein translocase subunit SecF
MTGTGQVKRDTPLRRLFTSQTRYDFIGRSRTWLLVALALVALAVAGALLRGINFNIDFTGGTAYHVRGVEAALDDTELSAALREEVAALVDGDVVAQAGTDPDGTRVALVTAPEIGEIGGPEQRAVRDRIAALAGTDDIDVNAVGPRWGERITNQMLRALGVFLLLVVIYITLRFEWRMAVAALVTLVHDLVLTVGVYALFGFEVSPASVIALLTILGYSLYDTVVVFDRVADDARELDSVSNRTYGEVANNAINQVLVRSISTSLTSLLPVGSLLLIGGQLLGADTLTDLALALFVGMAVGTYSSIFIATPLLVWFKEREPRYAELREKVLARRGGEAAASVQATGTRRRRRR